MRPDADRKGAKNRFDFAVTTGSCLMAALQEDWARYGADSFSFRVVETLEKKEDQSDKEFAGDLAVLAEMTRENYDPDILYP